MKIFNISNDLIDNKIKILIEMNKSGLNKKEMEYLIYKIIGFGNNEINKQLLNKILKKIIKTCNKELF